MPARVRDLAAAGNTFHVWNGLDGVLPEDAAHEARERCGASGRDGLLVVAPAPGGGADCRMSVVNADGSPAETCGNGLRCVAALLADEGLATSGRVRIATESGVREAVLEHREGRVVRVRVGMGAVSDVRAVEFGVDTQVEPAFLVDVGNPHCVLFGGAALLERLDELGPRLERHPAFPDRTNVELATVTGPGALRVRVWERGVGETRSCGSGACAVALAAVRTERANWPVRIAMPGGELEVDFRSDGLTLAGPVD